MDAEFWIHADNKPGSPVHLFLRGDNVQVFQKEF